MTLKAPPRRKTYPWAIAAWAAGAAIVLGGGGYLLLKPKEAKDPYRTEAVQRGDITRSVSASGSLQALVTVQVGSQISGQITKVLVDFNDEVKAGQVMAILDPQTYVSRAEQGRAQVAASQASVDQLQAQAEVARANYNRTKTLYDKGIAAKAALDNDLAVWKAAQANVTAGRANVTSAQASLNATNVELGRTTIVAPINGVVVDRQIEPGQTVAASLSAPVLFQIAQDLNRLEVKISVDEADIGNVREGQRVKFTVDAFPDDNFTGVVTQVRKQPETSNNVVAYTVIAEADNPGGKLLPGMTANADIVLEERRDVLRVPAAALRWTPADQTAPRQQASGPMGGPPGMGAGGGQRQQGGQRGGRMLERVTEALDLDNGQQAKAKVIFERAQAKARAAGGDNRRQAMQQANQAAFTELEAILKPDQKPKLIALRASLGQGGRRGGAGGMTSGVVYVLKDGKPTPVQVLVGATDGSFTEIVDRSGALKQGALVITGGGPKAQVQAANPMAGGGRPRVRGL
ncbi:efflux RND transporter periplasmic adaptor subunit [Caulobacter sp. SLTY]|uniref:efflux RND transporter periplasmic adaptor subunit n=1 Tax=Caulobacter sp. SLTY TaxID=2683262 RepID=UPI00141266EB|nr:efflux RND transporter periplasmic adaptor subunit [Caulobacter sp. SLTY]NBB15350.1 efflux RND transporter periplasmic adaptor subunit [Caulobacter sp. SLTY]